MKRVLFLLAAIAVFSAASAKDYRMYLSINGEKISDSSYENDSVRVDFIFMGCDFPFVGVKITNKTKSRIYVEWENARIGSSNIFFMSDNFLTRHSAKQDELIHAGTSSRKDIGVRTDGSYSVPVFYKEHIKSFGNAFATAIIPIRYKSGEVDDISVVLYVEEYKKGAGI